MNDAIIRQLEEEALAVLQSYLFYRGPTVLIDDPSSPIGAQRTTVIRELIAAGDWQTCVGDGPINAEHRYAFPVKWHFHEEPFY